MGTTKLTCYSRGLHLRWCPSTSLSKPLPQPEERRAFRAESLGRLDPGVVSPSPVPAHDFDTIPSIAEDGTYRFGNGPGYPNGLAHIDDSKVGNGLAYSHLEGLTPWPLVMAFAAFLFFLGLSIGQPSSPTPVSYKPFWPLIADGAILGVISLYGYSRERFSVHEERHVESWPFREVPNVKLGIWTFLGAEVIFFVVFF